MSVQGKNNSIKEYYVNLQGLYNNAVNLLTAINQSLTTSASEVSITVTNNDNTSSVIRIPSFLYLENKLEQLDNNFGSLFNMPKSGEAWFNHSANMYKLEMVKSNVAPLVPKFDTTNIYSYSKYNTIFKDLVNPKTFIKLNINNLPENINEIYLKKIILSNSSLYNTLSSSNIKTYNDCKNALYNYNSGIDYEEYDSIVKIPLKHDDYISRFEITNIPNLESGNPWYPIVSESQKSHNHLHYKVRLNTIKYYNNEDNSIEYTLKLGDYLTLESHNVIYKIVDINISNNINTYNSSEEYVVELEEYIGHINIQTFEENNNMVLKIYNKNYDKYHFVELPLEENEYICIFIGTINNNVRSEMSEPIFLNLNTIQMKDDNGNFIYDGNSTTPMTYIQYYNKYCKNIGDLLLGFIESSYPQLSNYSKAELNMLQNSDEVKNLVTETFGPHILSVQKINNHLMDDVTSENILKLHTEKSEINIQLQNLQANINETYNQLITTDFSTNTSVNQESLRSKLDEYYNQRRILQNQQIAIVDNINILKGNVKSMENPKFRIRGNSDTKNFEAYLHENFNNKCDVIGLEIEYKYKSINSDTTNVSIINSSVFTDWNRCTNIDKERKIVFDDNGNYTIQYENYDDVTNVIKWNQFDIPITQGEDVVIRIRYKYCIGQPFINFYTPWSDEITMVFPPELNEETDISSVLEKNDNDTTSAKFNNTLISEGYQEHITNKIIDNSQVFYHMPENIYSGFNTNENKLISLKDKLNSLTTDLNEYKNLIMNELNSNYKVYLEYDNLSIELSNSSENNISINTDTNGNNDVFIKKPMNIIIKNTGTTDIKLYSIFPGNVNIPLLLTSEQFYDQYIINYERVPLLCGDSNIPKENIYTQKLGQWIYFRQNNPYSKKDYYFNDYLINDNDLRILNKTYTKLENSNNLEYSELNSGNNKDLYTCKFSINFDPENNKLSDKYELSNDNYLKTNKQVLLGYRSRSINSMVTGGKQQSWLTIDKVNGKENEFKVNTSEIILENDNFLNLNKIYSNLDINFFIPIGYEYNKNNYLLCYEHICKILPSGDAEQLIYLTENDSLLAFISGNNNSNNNINGINNISGFVGGFFIPKLLTPNDLLCDKYTSNQYKEIQVGKSLTIPLIFEYFLDENTNKITKTIAFDLKTSPIKNLDHYIISVTANLSKNYVLYSDDTDNIDESDK